jgi:Na+/proline symporter
MIIVAVVFALGFEGFFVEIRGGVGLSLAFLMVFLGKWLRRSEVMTSAEWMKVRFGTDRQGRTAHLLSAIANIVLSLGMIIYFSKGAGKFLTHFVPLSEFWCTALMVGVGLAYTLMSGLYGVVFTDLVQMILLVFTAIFVSVHAFALRPEVMLPEGFLDIDFAISGGAGASLLAKDPASWGSIFEMFGLCVMMWLLRTTLEGMGGVGGYTDQRFFAARSEREASLLTFESIILSIFRWTMVAGLVVMGYHLVQSGGAAGAAIEADAEQVLPVVLSQMLPDGVRGLVIAGLIAAAMSTFDSTLNAGASYIVKDVYQSYLRPIRPQR